VYIVDVLRVPGYDPDRMPHRLIGNWNLLSYHSVHPDGSIGKPFGDAVGRLSYDDHGHMSGQVMRPDRAAIGRSDRGIHNLRAAYTGYIAYFGTYEVNDQKNVVVHHVHAALNPGWVGGRQVRRLRFEGDLLILEADVARPDGLVVHVLTWRKLP
jgi:hypothetical protein